MDGPYTYETVDLGAGSGAFVLPCVVLEASMMGIAGLGWYYDLGMQYLRMIFSGVFDRHPRLQVIAGHWGEVALFYLDHTGVMANQANLERPLADYFRQNFWVTGSGTVSERSMRWTAEVVGIERMMYSTDYPYTFGTRPGGFPYLDTSGWVGRTFLGQAPFSEEKAAIGSGSWERLTRASRRDYRVTSTGALRRGHGFGRVGRRTWRSSTPASVRASWTRSTGSSRRARSLGTVVRHSCGDRPRDKDRPGAAELVRHGVDREARRRVTIPVDRPARGGDKDAGTLADGRREGPTLGLPGGAPDRGPPRPLQTDGP